MNMPVKLSAEQESYLATIPAGKITHILPYTPRLRETADKLIAKVHASHPELTAFFGGSAGLGIAGQNDLDIDWMINPALFPNYFPTFVKLFSQPRVLDGTVAAWTFQEDGFEVDMWMTDPSSASVKEQQEVFRKLKDSPALLRAYEQMKLGFDGKPYREYQRAKYEFYHKIIA